MLWVGILPFVCPQDSHLCRDITIFITSQFIHTAPTFEMVTMCRVLILETMKNKRYISHGYHL